MKPTLHLICGVHESGKSHLKNKLIDECDFPVVLDGNTDFQKHLTDNKLKFSPELRTDFYKKEFEAYREAISEEKDIIVERAFLSVKGRSLFTASDAIKEADYDVKCYFVMPPKTEEELSLVEERMKMRSTKGKSILTMAAVNEQIGMVQVPNAEEGYSEVFYYDLNGNEIEYAPYQEATLENAPSFG